MAPDDADSTDPRAELWELTLGVRALLEQQRASGAVGLPAAATAAVVSTESSPLLSAEPAGNALSRREHGVAVPSSVPESSPSQRVTPGREPRGRSVGPSEEGRRHLAQLAQTVTTCQACGLAGGRTQTVFARGDASSGLCFVGEGPGADEDAQGLPFVGKAGQLLDRMIVAMGLTRDEVYVCNVVKCRPPDNRKPEPDEMAACRTYLEQQLELIQPEVIVALGATAVQGLLGTSGGITRLRGNWRLYKGIPVMPTFHPAYLLRTPSAKRQVWEDLQAVLTQMGRAVPPRS